MTRLIIAIVGAIGLVFVWRAAALYQGSDLLAYRMVLLIGVGLSAGLIELLIRATRIASLSRSLATLPAKPSREDISKSAEPLRSLLEARLNGTPSNLGSAVFTSYLLGLLVMIGLLGTFMGLFETLSGAREALTTSGDVAALREGLAAPMKGLSRAFGTSATGVACSAMLGLAAVFLRRAEARFGTAVLALAAGPLFPLTIAGRQLAAIEALAEDRKALPAAAKGIELVTKRLATLSTEIERGQRETSKEASEALRAAASAIQQDLQAGIAGAANAIAPLLDKAVVQAGEGAAKAVSAWTSRLDVDAEARGKRELAHHTELASLNQQALDNIVAGLAAASTRAEERDTKRLAVVAELASSAVAREEGVLRLLTEHAARVSALADGEQRRALLRAEVDAARDLRLAALGEKLELVATSIDARAEVVIRTLESQLQSSVERAAGAIGPLLDRAVERAADAATSQVERFSERLEIEAEQRSAEAQKRSDVLRANARDSLDAVTQLIAGAAQQADARDRERLAVLTAASQRVDERATLAAKASEAVPEAVSRFLTAEEQRLRERDRTDERRDVQLDGLILRLDGLAGSLELRSLEHAERAIELEQRLDRERLSSGAQLVEKLSLHAASLGQGLDATAGLVRDAAESVRAGGVELTAVAEMFTGAVDRYREANERWLDNLTTLEGAIEKQSGGAAAVDLLGAYLDQTREVFDHSLAFQRELFSELRALRTSSRPAPPRTVPPLRQPDSEKGLP